MFYPKRIRNYKFLKSATKLHPSGIWKRFFYHLYDRVIHYRYYDLTPITRKCLIANRRFINNASRFVYLIL